jgi:hypothetical protein
MSGRYITARWQIKEADTCSPVACLNDCAFVIISAQRQRSMRASGHSGDEDRVD